ncbi:hypothetical protein HMPREF1870_02866 [Bacteroidales bacterium KA00344]|nr:hypothetical protein HMPREF1870_02866 [Bacteroidales bacterium KA00344]
MASRQLFTTIDARCWAVYSLLLQTADKPFTTINPFMAKRSSFCTVCEHKPLI